jgi:hypothetical protein
VRGSVLWGKLQRSLVAGDCGIEITSRFLRIAKALEALGVRWNPNCGPP